MRFHTSDIVHLAMPKKAQKNMRDWHIRNRPGEWNTGHSDYVCRDNTSISVPNRAFRQLVYDENGFINTDYSVAFMNRVVYKRSEKTEQSRMRIFVSESEFDREMSLVVKQFREARTVIFPNTVR